MNKSKSSLNCEVGGYPERKNNKVKNKLFSIVVSELCTLLQTDFVEVI